MNRDALLASLIGFGIGLLITGVLLVGPTVVKGFPQIHLPTISLPVAKKAAPITPSPTPQSSAFAITSPSTDAVVATNDEVITGTSPVGSTVVIAGPNDEDVVMVNGDGKFTGKITLNEGKNDITVTSLVQGKPNILNITVYFTKETW